MKTFTMSKTGLVTTIAIIAFALYDLVLVLFTGTGSSVSNFLISHGIAKSPLICVCFGYLLCHFVGGQMFEKKEEK